ncbi:hypothetical protein A6U96_14065 [Agrobacterium tumefaciens]|nr:hypothetical protein A6U96_14065 [Agrobacterium tumefaciens]
MTPNEFDPLADALASSSNVLAFNKTKAPKAKIDELRESYDDFIRTGNNWYGDWIAANGITNSQADYEIRNHICTHRRLTHDALTGHINFIEDFGKLPRTDKELIDIVTSKFGAKISFNGLMSATYNGNTIDKIEILKSHIESIVRTYKLSVPNNAVLNELWLWRDAYRQTIYNDVLATLSYDSNVNGEKAWEYVISQHDLSRHSAEYVKGVYAKFIWSVKRKMRNLPISYHLMPIIMGNQGTGKSYFVSEHLCKPLTGFINLTDFAAVADPRNAEQWEYPVSFLDEMAFASKSDTEVIKSRISSPDVSYRVMHTNGQATCLNKTTLIGCSNKDSLNEMIRDETGNRRFAPIYFSDVAGKDRKSPSDELLLALWNSIDENGPDPIDGFRNELESIQSTQKFKGPVEQYLNDFNEERSESLYKFTVMWDGYNSWKASTNTNCKFNKNQFYSKLASIISNNPKQYAKVVSGRADHIRFLATINDDVIERKATIDKLMKGGRK